jgi:tRNA-specific 2-thiouridylase
MVGSAGHVLVGMSGGVDSSVAAAALKREGFRVTGVSFRLWLDCDLTSIADSRSCCSLRDMEMAEAVAAKLDIEHITRDIREDFFEDVVEPFAREYMAGRTPNPCVDCNARVRFPAMRELAEEIGADYIATGHYARIEHEEKGPALLRALSTGKDQSYALYRLSPGDAAVCIFPNGRLSKSQVRAAARRAALPSAQKRESQELCFISGRNYREMMASRFPESVERGIIKNTSGEELGEHRGIAFYTIGQRSGLGVSGPEALYVTAIERETRTLIVGSREEVPGKWLRAGSVIWWEEVPTSFRAQAMVRYNSPLSPCEVTVDGDGFELSFEGPVWAITPGQHAVLYLGDRVIGGGLILEAS